MANEKVPDMEGFIEVKPSALFAHSHYDLWTFLANLAMTAAVVLFFGFPWPTRSGLLIASAIVLWLFAL